MVQCLHHDICVREALEEGDEGLCILHSKAPDKDKDRFAREFWDYFATSHNFYSFVFPDGWDFVSHEFPYDTHFAQVIFKTDVWFMSAHFVSGVNFRHARFEGRADFGHCTFEGGADFSYTQFLGKALFDNTQFKGTKYFNGVLNREKRNSEESAVPICSSFAGTKFFDDVNFGEAVFLKSTDFESIQFSKKACFYGVGFNDRVAFNNSNFAGDTDFRKAAFTQRASFNGCLFGGRTIFTPSQAEDTNTKLFSNVDVDFTHVVILQSASLTFRDSDLTNCCFLGTDLRKIEFSVVTWPNMPNCFGLDNRLAVHDETLLYPSRTNAEPHIEKLYRELKQNYDERRDYERAGDFHYGEMVMRQKSMKVFSVPWVLLTAYWLFSGYGERYLRPVICFLVIVLLSTVGYIYWGVHQPNSNEPLIWTWYNVLLAGSYSFKAMVHQISQDDLVPISYAKLLKTFQSILGPLLIGFFGLAFRQRFKR